MDTISATRDPGADDVWLPSSCALCYGTCSILAHRVDGVVVKIEGNPESVVGKGKLCGKGVSGLMTHYDPNRVRVPLRRTNPEKGIGVDPKWREITWDEALDEICGHLTCGSATTTRANWCSSGRRRCNASMMPYFAFMSSFRLAQRFDRRRRRPPLRQRRPFLQRPDACVLVDRAGFRALQLRRLFRRFERATAPAMPGDLQHGPGGRRPGARHENGGGRSDVQFRLRQGDRMGADPRRLRCRRWRSPCAT